MKKLRAFVAIVSAVVMCCSFAMAGSAPQIIIARDQDGNEVNEIYIEGQSILTETEDGVVITPIDFRDNSPTEEIKNGLKTVYEDQQTHTLGNLTGEEDGVLLYPAVDEYLYEINHPELNADDFEIIDSFNAIGSGSLAEYLSRPGTYIDITYHKTLVDEDSMLVVPYSLDGKHWLVKDKDSFTKNADGTVTIRMEDPGYFSLAILTQGGGKSTKIIETEVIPTPTPVITEKPIPTDVPSPVKQSTTKVIGAVDSHGDPVVTYEISNLDFVPNDDDRIIITPVEFRENAPTEKIETDLDHAFEISLGIYSAAELLNKEGASIKDEMDKYLAEVGRDDLTAEDMAVLDVFHVLGSTRYEAFLEVEENYIDVTYLALGLEQDKTLVVLFGDDGIHWSVYPEEYVTRNADGSVTVRMYDFGHFSFVVEVAK